MVNDCRNVFPRLKAYNIDFEWNSSLVQNPYNFGTLNRFRLVVKIDPLNEN